MLHPDSDTVPVSLFDVSRVFIGKGTYGELNVVDYGEEHVLRIGNFVSIAQKVTFILDAEHYVNHISTYPFMVKTLKKRKKEAFGHGDIVIDDDVWIGYGATIMSGVHIGQGAVIAAGAIVTRDVSPYSVVAGIPCREIRKRFDNQTISILNQIDFSKFDEGFIRENIDNLYKDIEKVEDVPEWLKDRLKYSC